MGPMPASVIATPEALFKRIRKYEFNANAKELFDNPYPIAVLDRSNKNNGGKKTF